MKEKAAVFEETYRKYLKQVADLDHGVLVEKLGVQIVDNEIEVLFFNKKYRVSTEGITDFSGKKPLLKVSVALCRYLIMVPEKEPEGKEWCSFRDFKDAGPLTVFFTNEVEQLIAGNFSGSVRELENACKELGGYTSGMDLSYDFSMEFFSLPKLPLLLLFNDADDEFPAHCSVLFQKSADKYLDAESLAIVGSLFADYLTGK